MVVRVTPTGDAGLLVVMVMVGGDGDGGGWW